MKNSARFENDLCTIINKHSMENESNTPDYILARYLMKCLENFNTTVDVRNKWYGTDQAVAAFGNQSVQPR